MRSDMRRMLREELPGIYRLVKADFPPAEYPPMEAMQSHMRRDTVRGHVWEQAGRPAAYAFIACGGAGQPALLLLYAVERAKRGQGVGSAFLRAILTEYAACTRMYIEVERPELAKKEEERTLRQRRVNFYERLGFLSLPKVEYAAFGVPMRLYAYPLAQPALPDAEQVMREMRANYESILPVRLRRNLVMHIRKD